MAVAAHEQRQALEFCRQHCLEKRFQVPALYEHGIELTFPKPLADLRRVAARETVKRRPRCYIVQKLVSVSGKQAAIPVELDAEPSLRLIGCCRAMGEKDNKIESQCERAKERRVILDRMGGDQSEAHRSPAISFLAAQGLRLPVYAEPSLGKRFKSESIERSARIAAMFFGDLWIEQIIFEGIGQLLRSL